MKAINVLKSLDFWIKSSVTLVVMTTLFSVAVSGISVIGHGGTDYAWAATAQAYAEVAGITWLATGAFALVANIWLAAASQGPIWKRALRGLMAWALGLFGVYLQCKANRGESGEYYDHWIFAGFFAALHFGVVANWELIMSNPVAWALGAIIGLGALLGAVFALWWGFNKLSPKSVLFYDFWRNKRGY